MVKKVSIVLLVLFGLTAYVKPGLLKKIARCELQLDPYEIYPGNTFELTLLTKLKDSTEIISTESNLTINFADYNLEIKGGASIVDQTRTKIILQVDDDSYASPFVEFKITLRRKKSISYEVKLPILYDVTQKVTFQGKNGYDPRATTDNGYVKVPLFANVNLEFIDNEQTLTNNSDPNILGGKGPDLDLYVSLVKTKSNHSFLSVLVRSEKGEEFQKYIKVGVGQLEVYSIGGKGGISKSGGRGGDGGNVTVFITDEAKPFFNQIYIVNHGGDGGALWRPKVDGQKEGPYGNDGQVEMVSWQGYQ